MSTMEGVAADGRPLVGSSWEDARGRVLTVTRVEPADPLGRMVVGRVREPGLHLHVRDYATDLVIWQAVWRDKAEPWKDRA